MVVAQQSAEPFSALDLTDDHRRFGNWFDQPVTQPMMISLDVVMFKIRRDGLPQGRLPEKDQP
jgi:hypothetical protein